MSDQEFVIAAPLPSWYFSRSSQPSSCRHMPEENPKKSKPENTPDTVIFVRPSRDEIGFSKDFDLP